MAELLSPQEQKQKRRGLITSMFVHSIAVILLLLPFLEIPIPPPGQEGILVNLGLPDVGQGDENAGPSAPAEEVAPPPQPEPEPEPEPEVRPTKKPEPAKEKPVVKTEDPSAVALRKQQEKERQERDEKARQEEAKRQAEAEAARKKAEEDARKKAEADKLKGDIGGLFGTGKGKGDTGKPGNQGDPNGDPNAKNLEGISTGAGTVGGSLGGRGVLAQPKITDNSQKEGTIVMSVCVDAEGNVVSADFTQRGSTTNDATLVSLAKTNAFKWKFAKGSVDKQCGTITYRFKVQ
jgi:outer membrane biosynthesis protein TonB